MMAISLSNVSFSYPILDNIRLLKTEILRKANVGGRLKQGSGHHLNIEAIRDLSLDIQHGERVGLLGHNGCGKSTLLRLIAGIFFPDSGRVQVTGHTIPLFDMASGMNPDATGLENIYLRGYLLGLSTEEIDEKKHAIIEFSELEDFIHLPVSTYSQGMFVRLAFSISTAIAPDILLIDEGIGAGDANFQAKASQRIRGLMEQTSILVFASHSEALLKMYCQKIVKMACGNVESCFDLK